MKNELDKPGFDEKRMGRMYEEMHSSLGNCNTGGHGMFRARFIRVCSFSLAFILVLSQNHVYTVQMTFCHLFFFYLTEVC